MKNYCCRVFYRVIWNGRGDGEWGGGRHRFHKLKTTQQKLGYCVLQPCTAASVRNHGHNLFKRVRLQEKFLQEKHDSNAVVSMRVAVTKAKLHAKNTATRV